ILHAALGVAGRGLVPLDLQLFAGGLREPPAIRHDRDTVFKARIAGQRDSVDFRYLSGFVPIHDIDALDSGQRLDLVDIRARDLAPEYGRFLEDRVLHVRHNLVDREERLAGDDQRQVALHLALADDGVLRWFLELQGGQLRHRERHHFRGNLAVADGAVRTLVGNDVG